MGDRSSMIDTGPSVYGTAWRLNGFGVDTSGRVCGSSPETYAALKRINVLVSVFRNAEPGIAGSSYASGTPSTARLSEAEKERYARFGEWRGRSGGYAIQTLGSTLVERVEGSVSNVVGLPIGLLADLAPELLEPK